MSPAGLERWQPSLDGDRVEALRARLRSATLPDTAAGDPWDWGLDLGYLSELLAWWAEEYDPRGLLDRLWPDDSWQWEGIHLIRLEPEDADGEKLPILLIHGWPGAPLEFSRLAPLLVEAGHEVVIPSIPGYGFSRPLPRPETGSEVAARFVRLMDALGHERFIVQGGDWGAFLSGRIAFSEPGRVAGMHLNAPGVLPLPGKLDDPPLGPAEIEFAQKGAKWRTKSGFHMMVHGYGPDALGAGLDDSPVALAGWLLPRYRAWSDCGGDLQRRFSRRQLCDLLSFYWLTRTGGSALRLYAAEGRSRWRLGRDDRITVPAAIADFPVEIVQPPRPWVERICSDIRSWTEMPCGGHFAAHEEPELLARDVLAFAATLER